MAWECNCYDFQDGIVIDVQVFEKVVGQFKDVVLKSATTHLLQSITVMHDSCLDNNQIMALVDLIETHEYSKETTEEITELNEQGNQSISLMIFPTTICHQKESNQCCFAFSMKR